FHLVFPLTAADPFFGTVRAVVDHPLQLTYTPGANQYGTAKFYYSVAAGPGGILESNVATVTINVVPVNDSPTDISLASSTVARTSVGEPAPAGTAVGKLRTTDADSGDTFTYRLAGGPGYQEFNSRFTINADGTLRTAASFDFETRSFYPIYVRSTDANGLA